MNYMQALFFIKAIAAESLVVQACNPRCLGSRDRRIMILRPALAKIQDHISKIQ
jgi:hypothetical protein